MLDSKYAFVASPGPMPRAVGSCESWYDALMKGKGPIACLVFGGDIVLVDATETIRGWFQECCSHVGHTAENFSSIDVALFNTLSVSAALTVSFNVPFLARAAQGLLSNYAPSQTDEIEWQKRTFNQLMDRLIDKLAEDCDDVSSGTLKPEPGGNVSTVWDSVGVQVH